MEFGHLIEYSKGKIVFLKYYADNEAGRLVLVPDLFLFF